MTHRNNENRWLQRLRRGILLIFRPERDTLELPCTGAPGYIEGRGNNEEKTDRSRNRLGSGRRLVGAIRGLERGDGGAKESVL